MRLPPGFSGFHLDPDERHRDSADRFTPTRCLWVHSWHLDIFVSMSRRNTTLPRLDPGGGTRRSQGNSGCLRIDPGPMPIGVCVADRRTLTHNLGCIQSPAPISHLRHILAIQFDVLAMLCEFVTHLFHQRAAGSAGLRQSMDRIYH